MVTKRYRGLNKQWLKFCCKIGWHFWVYARNESYRTCRHPWCTAHQDRAPGTKAGWK